jgi:HAE1 family hydrophobic/amphiphilic exporter-1
MMIGALVVFGLLSYPRVGVDLFPSVEFPIVTVTVVYPGADPETMESEVADPIEEKLNTLSGIRVLRSANLEGVSQIVVEFELEVNTDKAMQDIRDKLGEIQAELPPQAEPPSIQKLDTGAAPILAVALSGKLSPTEMTRVADKVVKERLQRVTGVGAVDLVGGRERQIQVLVDSAKLVGLGITVEDVGAAIRTQNLNFPGGFFERGQNELVIKTKGEVTDVAEIEALSIPNATGAVVRVRDVAQVKDGMEDARSASFLNGESALSLVVRKQSGANSVAVAEKVRAALEEIRPRVEARGVKIAVPTDNSVYIAHSIHDVQFDLAFGAILAVLIILFFLHDFRATLISAVAIPTSVVATFAFIDYMGFTFNNMTMLGLSLSIGILIDDAIVVIENIHRHVQMGKSVREAASSATAEIFLAVLATTSCIMAVFVPVAFMKGIIGRFFFQFGLTVSFAVAVSMLVSFTLTPMLSSRFLKVHHGASKNALVRFIEAGLTRLDTLYGGVLRAALRHRVLTLAAAAAALAASFVLVTQIKTEFAPVEDRGEFSLNVELPTGTSLEASKAIIEAVARDIRQNAPGVALTFTTIGEGAQGQVNLGKVQVVLVPKSKRAYHQEDLMAWARTRYRDVKDAKVSATPISPMGGQGGFRQQPVQLNVRGSDMEQLVRVTSSIIEELRKVPGLVDLDSTYRGGKPEVSLSVDRERAADLGVPVSSIGATIRALVADDPVSELKEGTDIYDIVVRLPKEQRDAIAELSNVQVRSASGALVDLSNVVDVERGEAPTQIERQARQRQITVLAGLEGLPLGEATKIVDQVVARLVPAELETDYAGMADIMGESFKYMLLALVLAIVLVYMILAAQFDSFVQPITIMLSLPLSVVGAFGALFITGMTLNIFSMIGIIMLMGLVTKNAILLVDFANHERTRGLSMLEALVSAGTIRLRPILMTTAAMVFGMLPVALALSEGGEARAPMAVCVIGGLITSTLLTLVVVPVVYTLMESMTQSRLVQWFERRLLAEESVG